MENIYFQQFYLFEYFHEPLHTALQPVSPSYFAIERTNHVPYYFPLRLEMFPVALERVSRPHRKAF